MLYGIFCPAGLSRPIQQVEKSRLSEIVNALKRLLIEDWNDANFVIGSKYTTIQYNSTP